MPSPGPSHPPSTWHDTLVLPGSPEWHDTAVLRPPVPAAVPSGWYADPFAVTGLRYFDGFRWTTATTSRGPVRKRRSVGLAFLLAFCFGVLALPYALPLPGWARLLMSLLLVLVFGWWTLLLVPLTWPLAIIGVPVLTAVLNPRR